MNQRIYWIDWAKALGIWLVVFGHAPAKGHIFIYMFHMPFFFMLSGYLYRHVGLKEEIRRSFKGLIIPYLLYNGLLCLIAYITGVFQSDIIYNVLLGNQEGIMIRYFSPLWFLISLFIMRIILSLIKSERRGGLLASLCVIISFYCYNKGCFSYNYDYFQICTTLVCIPFFIGGYIMRMKNLFVNDKVLNISEFVKIGGVVGLLFFIGYNNGMINVFRATRAGDNILIFYLVGFGLSYYIIKLIAIYLKKRNVIVKTSLKVHY